MVQKLSVLAITSIIAALMMLSFAYAYPSPFSSSTNNNNNETTLKGTTIIVGSNASMADYAAASILLLDLADYANTDVRDDLESNFSDSPQFTVVSDRMYQEQPQDDNNIIVIGGSCVNMESAKLLNMDEESSCGEEFTNAAGIGEDQFIIKRITTESGKQALLVAGYNEEDTMDAVRFLLATNQVNIPENGQYVSPMSSNGGSINRTSTDNNTSVENSTTNDRYITNESGDLQNRSEIRDEIREDIRNQARENIITRINESRDDQQDQDTGY